MNSWNLYWKSWSLENILRKLQAWIWKSNFWIDVEEFFLILESIHQECCKCKLFCRSSWNDRKKCIVSDDSIYVKVDVVTTLPICFSMSAASSGVARGMTPGSEKLVRNKVAMTKANRNAPTTGIAGVICTAKNGQLKATNRKKKPSSPILTNQWIYFS